MLPEGVEELVLWQDEDKEEKRAKSSLPAVKVDNMLTRWLRPHQREGGVVFVRVRDGFARV